MEPNGDKRRGFAVGDPARRSRDGNGKIAVRGGEAMAAKRTAAQARSEMPRPLCAANPKGGTGNRPARFRRRQNATEREQGPGRETVLRVGKRASLSRADYESLTAYFLSIKKVGKER